LLANLTSKNAAAPFLFYPHFRAKGDEMNKPAIILLAIWLILMGAVQALNLSFNGLNVVLGVLAIIAGVMVLLDRLKQA
jgi:hypothetical protein